MTSMKRAGELRLALAGAAVLALFRIISFAPDAAAQEQLKVGVMLPLSGPLASMGEACRRGFGMYVEEHSKDLAAQFIFEDHKYDGRTAVSGFYSLVNVKKVEFVVVWGVAPSETIAPIAERLGVPTLAATFDSVESGRKFVAAIGPTIDEGVSRLVEQFSAWDSKVPAALTVDIGNAVTTVNLVKQRRAGKLLVKVVPGEENDFKTIIAALKLARVDGLILFALPDQALTFIRQAAELKFAPKIVGGDIFADEVFNSKARALLPDVNLLYGAVEAPFIERVQARWHSRSFFFETAVGYVMADTLNQLAKQGGRGAELMRGLNELEPNQEVLTGLRLDRSQHGLRFLNEIKVYSAGDF